MTNKLNGVILRLGQLQQEVAKVPTDTDWAKRIDLALDDLRVVREAPVETPRSVWIVVRPDRGDGHHKIDTAGTWAYDRWVTADEDLSRWISRTGYAILEFPVVDKPQSLPSSDAQRERWEKRR